MDSQPAMLEVATGECSSNSNSSPSIISISQSGASSISTTSTTFTTNDHDQNLATQIHQLQEEKKLLEGRIRGYKTLSDLLVESRRENQRLKAQFMALQASGDKPTVSNPPFMQAYAGPSRKDLYKMDFGKLSPIDTEQKQQSLSTAPSVAAQTNRHTHTFGVALNSTEKGSPTSLQETTRPPQDPDETKLVSLPNTSGARFKTASGERTPMQESLGPVSNVSQVGSGSRDNLTSSVDNSPGKSPPLGAESPELLQFDSDKYDEATYEKVGLRLGMGHASLNGSTYVVGGDRSEPRAGDFPSLSSGLSGGIVHPSHHSANSLTQPPYMGMMHQSYIGQASDAGGSDLAAQVESISEQLNSEPGDGSLAIAHQMHAIAERIARVEQKKIDQKKLIQTLMTENQSLKQQVKRSSTSHQAELVALREENTRLMQQLKHMHQGSQGQVGTLPKAFSPSDWVHVERPLNTVDDTTMSEQTLVDRVRKLEQERAELHRANINWKTQWDQREQQHKVTMNELCSKLGVTEQELSVCKTRLAEQSSDFEARMLELKRRYSEEENAKEEALHHQRLAERRCQELQDQMTEIRTQLSDTARDKQALAAELSILKARTSGQETQAAGGTSGAATRTCNPALEAEIAMLRQQLTVYLEDFEHEREDRTAAQQARDVARKNVETLTRANHQLNSQIKHLQRQLKDRDDTISTTLRQNEALQRQVSDHKKKLAAEWEQKQSLQRSLLALQQHRQQQGLRNPYLSPEPYTTTQPLYQPPLTTPTYTQSGPYFGRQMSQLINRTGAATMSPEHLPGAWTCVSCTYVNYPGRTVCEMCGIVNSPRNPGEHFGFMSNENMYGSGEHPLLMSRGGDQRQTGGAAAGDLVVDSGMDPAGISPH